MRRVGVERTATVLTDLLDGFLAGDRTTRDRLLLTRHGGDRLARIEVLDHALAEQERGKDEREREEDARDGAHEVDPEVSERASPPAHETANQGNGDGRTSSGGDEVVERKPRHLAEVRHRHFTRVVLPVRVREEADRRVERKVGSDVTERVWVER